MTNIDKYIMNGRVEREKIALDIKYGVLKQEDIILLIKNESIKAAFIDNVYRQKMSRESWNKDYLDELSYAVISESFNEDYLLYLNSVAEYVRKKERNRKRYIIGISVASIVAVLIVMLLNK